MIQLSDVSLSYGSQVLFEHVSIALPIDMRVGIVGRNGAGKSTLLKLIAGHVFPDQGTIKLHGARIAYLPQEIVITSTESILDTALAPFADRPEELGLLQARAQELLIHLGFEKEQLGESVASLSTGWKMRIALVQLLLTDADVYAFDEPTNHLDIVAQAWFMNFLKSWDKGFFLISHERRFLEDACTHILEIQRGQVQLYHGSYTDYLEQRAQAYERQKSAYERQQKELAQKTATIERFRASATKSAMAQSMIRALEKIERIAPPESDPQPARITFPVPPPAPRHVVQITNLSFAYNPAKPLFTGISCTVERCQRVAIIARNGVGKSTLLKLITGRLHSTKGSIQVGDGVQIGYFQQDHHLSLNPKKTVWQTVNDDTRMSDAEVRGVLGALLFTQDTVDKPVSVLSGGERTRVCLAQLLVQQHNVLILDEPTNHLDLYSRQALAQALTSYRGTIIFVSHDASFVQSVANVIIDLSSRGCITYQGTYDEWMRDRTAIEEARGAGESFSRAGTPAKVETSTPKRTYEQQREAKRAGEKVERLEREIEAITQRMFDHEYGSAEYMKLCIQLEQRKKDLTSAWENWELRA